MITANKTSSTSLLSLHDLSSPPPYADRSHRRIRASCSMVATTVLASPSRAASLTATPPPPRTTLAAVAAPARTPTEEAVFRGCAAAADPGAAGGEIPPIGELVLLRFELAPCSARSGAFLLRFVPERSRRFVFGDGYVGMAQDAVKIRRLEKQREAERRKIKELKNKSKRVNICTKIEEEEKEKLQNLQQEEELQMQKRKKRRVKGDPRLSFCDDIENVTDEDDFEKLFSRLNWTILDLEFSYLDMARTQFVRIWPTRSFIWCPF